MHHPIENDPQLKLEYERIMKQTEQENQNYSKERLEEHLKTLQMKQAHNIIPANNFDDCHL